MKSEIELLSRNFASSPFDLEAQHDTLLRNGTDVNESTGKRTPLAEIEVYGIIARDPQAIGRRYFVVPEEWTLKLEYM